MRELIGHLRYALRILRKQPVWTTVIVLSLGIGIGANTAIFSVAEALLLKPLPYPHPDRLAILWLRSPGVGIQQDWPSPGQYIDIQTQNHVFEEMAIAIGGTFTLTGHDQPERIEGIRTSSSLFPMLGASPLLGRVLLADEDKPGKPPVAILSHAVWKRLFGGDSRIVNQTIILNGNPYTVVGVLQPEFSLNHEVMPTVASIDRMEIFLPLPFGADAVKRRGDENYNVLVRLKPGVSTAQAQADIDIIASRIRQADRRDRTFTISVVPLQEQVVGNVRRAVLVLLGSVALVLLIACANAANLLLSRATARAKEVAIRTALGAGWRQLVTQLLTESILLGVLGGAVGLAIAAWSLHVARVIHPGNIPRLDQIRIDAGVLAFTFAISVLTGVIFGVAPALRVTRLDLHTTLKSGGRASREGGLSIRRHRLRSVLVVGELALSLMLLIGAGLLIRSFVRLGRVPPGFNTDHVISMRLALTGVKYRQPKPVSQFYREVGQRILRLPGVKMQGAVSALPFTSSVGWGSIGVEGFVAQPGQELQVDLRSATNDYFRTMEVPLRKGRFFDDQDVEGHPVTVVIDERFAQRFWPREDPIGKHVWFNVKKPMTIVGVVGTVKQYGLETEGRIVAYFSHQQNASNAMYLVTRTTADPASLAGAIVREVHAVEPDVPVYEIRTMQDRLYDSLARQRFSTAMLGAFAGFAVLLAAVGVYGVISYLVAQGTHDIGVRIALGAQRSNINRLIILQGLALAGIGTAAGLFGAAALTRVMAGLLFGVSATDALTFSLVALLLLAIALVASYVPAHRATRVDPLVALRDE